MRLLQALLRAAKALHEVRRAKPPPGREPAPRPCRQGLPEVPHERISHVLGLSQISSRRKNLRNWSPAVSKMRWTVPLSVHHVRCNFKASVADAVCRVLSQGVVDASLSRAQGVRSGRMGTGTLRGVLFTLASQHEPDRLRPRSTPALCALVPRPRRALPHTLDDYAREPAAARSR